MSSIQQYKEYLKREKEINQKLKRELIEIKIALDRTKGQFYTCIMNKKEMEALTKKRDKRNKILMVIVAIFVLSVMALSVWGQSERPFRGANAINVYTVSQETPTEALEAMQMYFDTAYNVKGFLYKGQYVSEIFTFRYKEKTVEGKIFMEASGSDTLKIMVTAERDWGKYRENEPMEYLSSSKARYSKNILFNRVRNMLRKYPYKIGLTYE